MPSEYRVVSTADLMPPPRFWQSPAAKAREYAAALEGALTRMAHDGWELVDNCREPWTGAYFFIFRRDPPVGAAAPPATGIQELR